MLRFALTAWVLGLILSVGAGSVFGQADPALEIEEWTSMSVPDSDGIALGDIDGDGRIDLLTSSGGEGGVFWFEQGERPTEWQRHAIYERATEIEGNDLADFDGDGQLEAISLDQGTGEILLHRPLDESRDEWRTTAIQTDRLYLQASLVTDIDGDERPELVYTWEGTEPGAGGVHWLDFEGEAVHESAAWTDHPMVVHESAWWIAPRRVDANGDGRANEILYTARNLKDRNSGAHPGLFWIEPGANPTGNWKRHAVDTDLPHPLHVDLGQFAPNGEDRDAIVGGFDTRQVHYYTGTDSWQRRTLDLPTLDGESFNQIWNVKALPVSGHSRDAMLVVVSRPSGSAMVLYEPRGEQYRGRIVKQMDYTHPMDDRMVLHDLSGDGRPEIIVPDSGGGKLSIFRIKQATSQR